MSSPTAKFEDDVAASQPQQWLHDHGSMLYRYAIGKVRRPDVAEDLVQETLLAALRGIGQFRHDARMSSWLIGIMKRKVIDWLREQLRQRTNQSAATEPPDASLDSLFTRGGQWKSPPGEWHHDRPDSELTRKEFWAVLQSCLDQLPARLRWAFVLWQIDDQSTEEVCQELGVTATNLGVMLHRSRLRLWRCLSLKWYGRSVSELSDGTGSP